MRYYALGILMEMGAVAAAVYTTWMVMTKYQEVIDPFTKFTILVVSYAVFFFSCARIGYMAASIALKRRQEKAKKELEMYYRGTKTYLTVYPVYEEPK